MASGCLIKKKNKSGTVWAIKWRDDSGKQYFKTIGKRYEAKRALAEILAKINRGEWRPMPDISFSLLTEKWLELKKNEVRPRTYASYLPHARRLIKNFGTLKVRSITRESLEKWVANLSSQEKLSSETVTKCIFVLKSIFKKAVEWSYLSRSPAEFIKRPPKKKREAEFLEPEEIKKLIEATDKRYRTLIMFICLTGCRISEALALRWQDVDFASQRVFIRQVLQAGRFYEPKTAYSRRTIDIPNILVQELKTHQARLAVELEKNEHDLVFPNSKGKPEDSQNLRHRVLYPACKRAGIRQVGFHSLRHSYVSMLVAQGENVKTIQALVGHSSAKITWDTYSHLFNGETKRAVLRLEDRLFGDRCNSDFATNSLPKEAQKREKIIYNCRKNTTSCTLKTV